jgi:oligogalacturonide transport system permease protein
MAHTVELVGRSRRKRKSNADYQYIGLLFIAPWILGFLFFQLFPLLSSLYYSMTNYDMIRKPVFTGLHNYIQAFSSDMKFQKSLLVTFAYVAISVPLKLMVALGIAMLLNMKTRFIAFFRTLYYLPSILGASVAVAVLWRFLFTKQGYINSLLALLGITGPDWIGDTRYALFTISLLTVWQFGSSMVLFLAGLKNVPPELYEAARIDGASRIRTFFKITFPMLSPIIFFNLVMQLIGGFQDFTPAMLITKGGPANATYLYGMLLYENAFSYFKMGYASALSWILFVIMIAITGILFRSSATWTHYEDGGRGA